MLFDTPAPVLQVPVNYETVLTWDSLERWLDVLQHAALVALDTETTSLVELQAQLVGISVCVATGQAAYIPLAHNAADAPAQLPMLQVLEKLKPWLEDASKAKLGQHVK